MAAKLKKGDKVVVLAGREKGKRGEIVSVDPKAGRAVVHGVNARFRHYGRSGGQEAGRRTILLPVDLSNLAIEDPEDGKPTRVGFRVEDGKKKRYSKRSGALIDG